MELNDAVRNACSSDNIRDCLIAVCQHKHHDDEGNPAGKLADPSEAYAKAPQQGKNFWNNFIIMYREFGKIMAGQTFAPLTSMSHDYMQRLPTSASNSPSVLPDSVINNRVKIAEKLITTFDLCPPPQKAGESAETPAKLTAVKYQALDSDAKALLDSLNLPKNWRITTQTLQILLSDHPHWHSLSHAELRRKISDNVQCDPVCKLNITCDPVCGTDYDLGIGTNSLITAGVILTLTAAATGEWLAVITAKCQEATALAGFAIP